MRMHPLTATTENESLLVKQIQLEHTGRSEVHAQRSRRRSFQQAPSRLSQLSLLPRLLYLILAKMQARVNCFCTLASS